MRLKFLFAVPAMVALILTGFSPAYAQSATALDRHQVKTENRIRDMYATLHITKAQEVEWEAFAQVMLDNAQAMDATLKQYGGDRAELSTPQILDNYAAISDQHARNVERLSAAMDVLYANLSAEQKKAADVMFRYTPKKKQPEEEKH